MKLTYDPRHNVAYIRLREQSGQVETIRVSDELNINLAPDGMIYGIELLNANEQLRAGDGFLVNVASVAGYQPTPGFAVYGATKAFVRSFTEALWAESAGTGLRVLALSPGPTATEFFEVAGEDIGSGLPKMTARKVVGLTLRELKKPNPGPSVVPGPNSLRLSNKRESYADLDISGGSK